MTIRKINVNYCVDDVRLNFTFDVINPDYKSVLFTVYNFLVNVSNDIFFIEIEGDGLSFFDFYDSMDCLKKEVFLYGLL